MTTTPSSSLPLSVDNLTLTSYGADTSVDMLSTIAESLIAKVTTGESFD